MTETIWKSALKSFVNTFLKVIAIGIGILTLIVIFVTISSDSVPRNTTTIVLPTQDWKAKPFSTSTPTILKIPVTGTIGLNPMTTKDQLAKVLEDVYRLDLKPELLKAIVLYIDSPGGGSDDSDGMLRLLLEFKKNMNIPIYAYVDGMCASGGMMIALAADTIYATPPSLIGHVGVIMPTAFNFCKTMEKVGVESKTLSAGKNKDEMNPFRPWKPDEGNSLQRILNVYYDRFVKLVTTYRPKITAEQLHEQGAQVYPAEEALELGYIDKIKDSFFEALAEISSTLAIENDYQVIELRPQIGLTGLFSSDPSASIFKLGKLTVHHTFSLPGQSSSECMQNPLYLYQEN